MKKKFKNSRTLLFMLFVFITWGNITTVNAKTGDLKVSYIDVGQADSILIQQGNQNMLIDAGNNADDKLVVNYLKKQGVAKIDVLIGTHPDEDHIGGLDTVIKTFNIGKVYMPKVTKTTATFKDVVTAIKNKNMKISTPKVGESFNLGQAQCTILAPNSNSYEGSNNYSIVTKLKYGNTSFIFMGDAESISEGEILQKQLDVQADVIKIGHHGSHSSSGANFLNKVKPKYAIISCGKANSYGHPHQETMALLKSKHIQLFRTDEAGTIVAISNGKTVTFNKKAGSYNTGSKSIKKPVKVKAVAPVKKAAVKKIKKANTSQSSSVIVYITETGHKYHRDGCRYLSRSQIKISLNEAKAGYDPCSVCDPPQ